MSERLTRNTHAVALAGQVGSRDVELRLSAPVEDNNAPFDRERGHHYLEAVTGVSYRQLDYWSRTLKIFPQLDESDGRGSGTQRRWDLVTPEYVRSVEALVSFGLTSDKDRSREELIALACEIATSGSVVIRIRNASATITIEPIDYADIPSAGSLQSLESLPSSEVIKDGDVLASQISSPPAPESSSRTQHTEGPYEHEHLDIINEEGLGGGADEGIREQQEWDLRMNNASQCWSDELLRLIRVSPKSPATISELNQFSHAIRQHEVESSKKAVESYPDQMRRLAMIDPECSLMGMITDISIKRNVSPQLVLRVIETSAAQILARPTPSTL
jgi:hypothetical protein